MVSLKRRIPTHCSTHRILASEPLTHGCKPRAARRVDSADTRRNTSEPSEDFGMLDYSPCSPQLCCRGQSSQDMPNCTWQEGREKLSFQVVIYIYIVVIYLISSINLSEKFSPKVLNRISHLERFGDQVLKIAHFQEQPRVADFTLACKQQPQCAIISPHGEKKDTYPPDNKKCERNVPKPPKMMLSPRRHAKLSEGLDKHLPKAHS